MRFLDKAVAANHSGAIVLDMERESDRLQAHADVRAGVNQRLHGAGRVPAAWSLWAA
jgi:hypothetical protein